MVSGTWSTCSVIKHACACGQKNHSSFCHFKPFAFLHPICDGALTCSSISLQWQQYHRNQDVGRLDVTGNVHSNDLKKHIFCLVKFYITEMLAGAPWPFFFRPSRRPVSYCPFISPVWYLETARRRRQSNCELIDGALEGGRMWALVYRGCPKMASGTKRQLCAVLVLVLRRRGTRIRQSGTVEL